MKKIMGKTDRVAGALERLDVLTKEENLMTAARTLEVAQHADDKITIIEEVLQDVNGNVRATQELTYHVDRNVTATKEGISDIAGDVEETKVLAHHVDDNVTVVKEDVEETKVLAHNVDDNVTVIKELTCELRSDVDVIKGDTRSVNDNIKVTRHGAPHFQFLHTRTYIFLI
jgi:methyl-accepting chemotaxis protein